MSEPPAVPAPVPVEQLHFAMPPVHASPDEERTYRRQRLAGALRLFGQYGYEDGVSGHITVRDPEHPDMFWVNPFGMSFRHIRVSDLILVDHEGVAAVGDDHGVHRGLGHHPALDARRDRQQLARHAASMPGGSRPSPDSRASALPRGLSTRER